VARPEDQATPDLSGARARSGIRRVRAIVNGAAGTVAAGETAFEEVIAGIGASNGLVILADLVEGGEIEGAARRALAEARAGRIDAIAIGGGDGTIRTVAGVLADTGVPLAILPLGTLNHFAKDLGIPGDLAAAVALIGEGKVRAVDAGEVNGRLFINNSSIGLYPYMVADRERRRAQAGMSKWVAMALAALRVARRFPRRRLLVRTAGATTPYRTACLFVGNNEYEMNFLSLGRKRVDGGRLYLYITRPVTAPAFLWFALKAGLGLRLPELDRLEVESAEISSRTSRLPVAFDGEIEVLAPPLAYRARPGALAVILPAEEPAGGSRLEGPRASV
jgi:diacylglycerol kinase family enzyme